MHQVLHHLTEKRRKKATKVCHHMESHLMSRNMRRVPQSHERKYQRATRTPPVIRTLERGLSEG